MTACKYRAIMAKMNLLIISIMSLLAGVATGIGGIIGVLFKPGEKSLVFGLGFSSGIMLGVTFLLLIVESLKAGFVLSFSGFIVGTLVFFILDFIVPHIHIVESRNSLLRLGTLIAIGIAIHDLPEGFGIGMGYGVSERLGITLALAIILHNIPEGIAIAIPFRFSGMNKVKTVLIAFAAGLSTLIGALIAFFLHNSISEEFMYSGLAFAAGAMFYISVNELIPEAHKYGNTRYSSLGVIAGVIIAFTLTLLSE
ncbi:ZIP family metal transporter [Chloroflexota bacterium]